MTIIGRILRFWPGRQHRRRAWRPLLVFLAVLAVLVACGDEPEEAGPTPAGGPTTVPDTPTDTPAAAGPAVESAGQTWLVMLYQDADDQVLEKDIYLDLNEAELIGSNDQVHVVSLIDRYGQGFQGPENWTGARRFYLTQDDDVNVVNSPGEDLGEINMADAQTLIDFVTWAIANYPADKHALILSDHGLGWPGGWSDADSGGQGGDDVAFAQESGDGLYLMELDAALAEIRSQTGLEKFELIGFDACLMGHIEVFSAMAPHARYAVASQEVEPAVGWAYAAILQALTDNPEMDGAELAQVIVDSYIDEDVWIANEEFRGGFEIDKGGFEIDKGGLEIARYGFGTGQTAEEIAQALKQDTTLAAVDLSLMPDLLQGLDNLAYALNTLDQGAVAEIRTYTQPYTNVFGDNLGLPSAYVDLGSFAALAAEWSEDDQVAAEAEALLALMDQAIIAEEHGPSKAGATGLSIYFPTSGLYFDSPTGEYNSYATIAGRFAEETRWDEFLVAHYTDQFLEPDQEVDLNAEVYLPWATEIEITPFELSAESITLDESITIETTVTGDNLGYIYFFVGWVEEENADEELLWIADMDYVVGEDVQQFGGLTYPDWSGSGSGEVQIEWEWLPVVYGIDDGTNVAYALFYPEVFGASPEENIYSVDGVYTFTDSGEQRYARLYFRFGELIKVVGFTGEEGSGAPREITPQIGDEFTVLDQYIVTDISTEEEDFFSVEGDTLVFGAENFTWVELPAPGGYYWIGFIAEDLDGNYYEWYELIEVVE
ncbi:MAG: clostripain-related cysteine peptidase [Chloroflexi bacterium]|nr:clostripain-related cysteine peptidase [Chloroflexota bacterium]MCI0644740.1 clostripain-related cysteine peptidase [Chloroflexota bacterium]MCI0728645.1 clostripain-related cysteine peptidase [Chloroflexota bacterium]